jgi:peptidoglycan/xylan/chitin deacetylase (PgdA/CDA1 family)
MPSRRCATAALTLALAGCAAAPNIPAAWTLDHEGIIRGDPARKRLALVFTGGSYGEGGPAILDALKREHVKASFFVTGEFLEDPQRRALVQRMVAEGHYVGPHSHAHPLYCPWDDRAKSLVTQEEFVADLARNIAALRELGALPPGQRICFIPPFEWYNADQVRWARDMGVTLFNFTPGIGSNRDWIPEDHPRFVSSARILEDILAFEAREPAGLKGAIVLLHLGSARTDKMHRYVPSLLAALRARGYICVRIDELLAAS